MPFELPARADQCAVLAGDCLAVLPTLAGESFGAVITDPPYGVDFQSNQRVATEQFDKIANDEQPFVWWLWEARRVLRPGGCLVCFCRWDVAEAFRLAIGWAGFEVKSQLIWDRGTHGMGDLKGAPAPQHDTIWFATAGNYQLPGYRPTSVYKHLRLNGGVMVHPNQKPVNLMRELIRDYVPEGGVVLDPFGGSGTTGVAAVLEGVPCVLIEQEPKYVDLSRRRVARAVADTRESLLSPTSMVRRKPKPVEEETAF